MGTTVLWHLQCVFSFFGRQNSKKFTLLFFVVARCAPSKAEVVNPLSAEHQLCWLLCVKLLLFILVSAFHPPSVSPPARVSYEHTRGARKRCMIQRSHTPEHQTEALGYQCRCTAKNKKVAVDIAAHQGVSNGCFPNWQMYKAARPASNRTDLLLVGIQPGRHSSLHDNWLPVIVCIFSHIAWNFFNLQTSRTLDEVHIEFQSVKTIDLSICPAGNDTTGRKIKQLRNPPI